MNPNDPAVTGAANHPMMPIVWTKTYKGGRIFTTTLGTSEDLLVEADRRLYVNAVYWALGLEGQIKPKSNVSLVGDYHPHRFGFGSYTKGVTVDQLR